MERLHRSVFPVEALELIGVSSSGVYLDLTFGEGGHSEAFLSQGANGVVSFDRDFDALDRYQKTGACRSDPRLKLIHGRFSQLSNLLSQDALFDGALMDLGPSTRQLLEPERGFSFSNPGPLDMRMDRRGDATLESILQDISVRDLADALERNADLRHTEKIARRLLEAYRAGQLNTTKDLGEVISSAKGPRHPATVLFLALRMLVNQEWEEVEKGIPQVLEYLKPGARLAVITFHSTEDRLVKRMFRSLEGRCVCDLPFCRCPKRKIVASVLKKPLVPSRAEIRGNPRARSAKLRCVEKLTVED